MDAKSGKVLAYDFLVLPMISNGLCNAFSIMPAIIQTVKTTEHLFRSINIGFL